MNSDNVCANLEVASKSKTEVALSSMYAMQHILQERLNQTGITDVKEQIAKLIYWRQCIHTECDELVVWFDNNLISDSSIKEGKMEVVDILHFVFNLGITLGLQPSQVHEACDNTDMRLDLSGDDLSTRLKINISALSITITDLLDLFPWKSWKTYTEPKINADVVLASYGKVIMAVYSLGIVLDMDEQEIGEYFISKNKENHARQDRGY